MRKATAFRGGANKTAPPCETLAIICYLATVPGEQLQRNISTKYILRNTDFQRPAKGGSTPAFACQHAAIAPLPCPNLQLVSQRQSTCELISFKKCNCSKGKQIAKSSLLRKCGLLAHTSAAFLKNCCTEKLFICLRLVPSSQQYYPLTSQKNRHRNFFRFHDGFLSALSPLLIHIEETEPSRISCKMFIQRRPI